MLKQYIDDFESYAAFTKMQLYIGLIVQYLHLKEFQNIDKLKKRKDSIFMVDVFHHLHRPNLVIKNLKKSLKKRGGKIIIFEPYVSTMSFIFYLITTFAGPKEKMGLFKKIDFSLKKRNLRDNFDFVMQPQKFFHKKIKKML